ncbi:MAG: DUF3365 domain-containing protein [Nitrospirae bacterium]|nr:DUF3365 domain-containing protein [Nitrospirota bacterium]
MNPKTTRRLQKWVLGTASLLCLVGAPYWGGLAMAQQNGELPGIPPQLVADYVHAIIEADRTVYSTHVVDPLKEKGILRAGEQWENQNTLPLPAQLLQAAGRLVAEKGQGIRYRLISLWPIYERNAPATTFERKGLESMIANPQQSYSGVISSGKLRYFQAIYPDLAVASTCVECHNAHSRSPKRDFQLNDVMGGIVITIPLGNGN